MTKIYDVPYSILYALFMTKIYDVPYSILYALFMTAVVGTVALNRNL